MNAPETHLSLFRRRMTPAEINRLHEGSAVERLGIEFTEVGPDYLRAKMPVDARTTQPAGILHGGSSVLLAETMGSLAGILCQDPGQMAVGLEVNASHLRAVREGWVHAECRPLRAGRTSQVWQVDICDDEDRLVCTSRITLAIVPESRK
jgi:uncharacterized protein (TIGR00369 family)